MYNIKDPVYDIIIDTAEEWARVTNWQCEVSVP
jgi:hypothetical protein